MCFYGYNYGREKNKGKHWMQHQNVSVIEIRQILLAEPEHSQGINPKIFDFTPAVWK